MSELTPSLEELRTETSELKGENEALKSDEAADRDTRQKVARSFVRFYFGILILIIISVPAYNYFVMERFHEVALIISLKDTILTYSAVVGSTFGLVVAYYFKSSGKN